MDLDFSDEQKQLRDQVQRLLAGQVTPDLLRKLITEDTGFDPGLLWLFLTLPSGGDLRQAEAAFDAEIDLIRTNGVTAAELSKARNQALADFWRGLATINGKAELLGSYAVLRGGYQKLFDAPRSYEQVTAEDVKKIAAEILRPSNRTVGVLAAAAEDKEAE